MISSETDALPFQLILCAFYLVLFRRRSTFDLFASCPRLFVALVTFILRRYFQVAKYPTAPVNAHPIPNATKSLLRSLLFLIASLYSLAMNGTSALAFQNPLIYMYAAADAATLNIDNKPDAVLRKIIAKELMSEKSTCGRDQISLKKEDNWK